MKKFTWINGNIISIADGGFGKGEVGLKLFFSLKILRSRLSGEINVKNVAKLYIYLSTSFE